MCTEVSEIVEAIRKPKAQQFTNITAQENFCEWYNATIKGSIHEELADVMIRLFDYSEAYKLKPTVVSKTVLKELASSVEIINVSSYLLFIKKTLIDIKFTAFGNESVAQAMAKIIHLANHYQIPLWHHIDYKMKYNSLRPYKHNKNF